MTRLIGGGAELNSLKWSDGGHVLVLIRYLGTWGAIVVWRVV